MGRAHDFGTILDAADALKGRPDIVFLFVGGGHRRTWIKTEVARRALTNVFIQPLQPRERLAETLGAADIHLVSLLPDLEGCIVPSKLYGILAAGRMTLFVGDPDGETARTIAAGNCGITVRIGDWPRLAELIVAYAEHPGLRHAAGARARELFDTRFTEAVGIDAWESILNELKLGGSAASLAPVGVVETPA